MNLGKSVKLPEKPASQKQKDFLKNLVRSSAFTPAQKTATQKLLDSNDFTSAYCSHLINKALKINKEDKARRKMQEQSKPLPESEMLDFTTSMDRLNDTVAMECIAMGEVDNPKNAHQVEYNRYGDTTHEIVWQFLQDDSILYIDRSGGTHVFLNLEEYIKKGVDND